MTSNSKLHWELKSYKWLQAWSSESLPLKKSFHICIVFYSVWLLKGRDKYFQRLEATFSKALKNRILKRKLRSLSFTEQQPVISWGVTSPHWSRFCVRYVLSWFLTPLMFTSDLAAFLPDASTYLSTKWLSLFGTLKVILCCHRNPDLKAVIVRKFK